MKSPGQILIEVLVAIAIFSIILAATVQLFLGSLEAGLLGNAEIKAAFLLQENLEAIRSVREEDWNNLQNGRFYPSVQDAHWSLVATDSGETVDQFTRWLEIANVFRDAQGQIVESGGQVDPSTKKVTSQVTWEGFIPRELTTVTYLTRYLDNLTWIQTTKAEFDAGEMDLTKTIDPPQDDGEVILEGGCVAGTPEALIYDDELRNGWRANCEGLPFWQWLICIILQFFSNAEIVFSGKKVN